MGVWDQALEQWTLRASSSHCWLDPVSPWCLRHYFCVWWGVWWVCGGSRSTSFTRLHQAALGCTTHQTFGMQGQPFHIPFHCLKKGGKGGANLSLSPAAEQTQVPSLPPPLSVLRLTADSQCDFVSLWNLTNSLLLRGTSQAKSQRELFRPLPLE